MYKDESLTKYLDDLAAKMPSPGGGSAAAMNAALGAALLSMVINFTLGKPKYAQYELDLSGLLEKSEALRKEFVRLVDLDCQAYESKNIRQCLDVPLMLARLCYEAIKLCPPLIKKGNVHLISDVGCAAVCFESAFAAARMNVEINLRSIEDKRFAQAIRKELRQKEKSIKGIRVRTEVGVGEIIGR